MLDAVNAIIYALEGDIDMAIISLICTIPIVGSLIGLPIKYAMRCGVDIGMAFMKFGIRNAPEITKGVSRLARAMKSKYDDASAWVSKKFAKFTPDSGRIPESGSKSKWWHEGYVDNLSDTQILLGVKQSNKGLSTLGSSTRETAMSAGKAWVEDNYNIIKDGAGNVLGYSSADGMRAFRIQ